MTDSQGVPLYGRAIRGLALASVVTALVVAGACIPVQPGGNDNEGSANDNVETVDELKSKSAILNLQSNFSISGADAVSLLYTVDGQPTSIDAYYVPVADTTPGAAPIGPEAVFEQNLPPGINMAVDFPVAERSAGNYRLGLTVTLGNESFKITTTGLVVVEDPPDPIFLEPVADLSIEPGEQVSVTFDCRKVPENVQWRLFAVRYDARDSDSDGVANGIDNCPSTSPNERESVDANGCGPTQDATDYDADGIGNSADTCPGTEPNTDVDTAGCSEEQRGVQIAVGSGNVGRVVWRTDNVTPATYRLGVSATDTGNSIAGTVAAGKSNRVVTRFTDAIITVQQPPPAPKPPTLVFTAPSADVRTFLTEIVTTTFAATIREDGAEGSVSIFLDVDTTPNNGNEDFLLIGADPATVSLQISTEDIAEGTYAIGGTVVDNINDPVSAYAAGRLIVVKTPTLEVLAPNLGVTVQPGAEVDVEWDTNVPPTAGTVDVFYQRMDADGGLVEGEIEILPPSSTDVRSTVFSQDTSGIYQVFVRIRFNDPDVAELLVPAPTTVHVSGLPAIIWAGAPGVGLRGISAAIFEGVNVEDNAGTSFASPGDLDGDGRDEFAVLSRYGKPFFINPTGIGPGEAYMVYGRSTRYSGIYNLNSIGTSLLKGVSFSGIRTPEGSNETDGMTFVIPLPDVDGDGIAELAFGFPNTASRGHNISPFQDGVIDPDFLCTLEEEDQFLRGGLVIVSSKNRILGEPQSGGAPVIHLDLVGQLFTSSVAYGGYEELAFADNFSVDPETGECVGSCVMPNTDGALDSLTVWAGDMGFAPSLADDFITQYVLNGCAAGWGPCLTLCGGRQICQPSSPLLVPGAGFSGFYPDTAAVIEPIGARIIGIGIDDAFATSASVTIQTPGSDGELIVSAPNRVARGLLCCGGDVGTETGPEISGLGSTQISGAGVAYIFENRNLWEGSGGAMPPRPHQYVVGSPSHCDSVSGIARIDNIDATRIAGLEGDHISTLTGISDFNRDGRNDFAIGAPDANEGLGRLYIAFRREQAIEDDYVLEKLSLATDDPERLQGVLVVAATPDAFGSTITSGVDFNGDGVGDLVVGSPNANDGQGQIVIIFADSNLTSPQHGVLIETLLATGRAAIITGNALDADGNFGFNVANGGDVNGDGIDDLLVAAPYATPRIDPDPSDANDVLTTPGLDLDFDGLPDPIGDTFDLPGFDDTMAEAGLVYVIYGSDGDMNRFDLLGGTGILGVEALGSSAMRGFMIAGRRAGDHLGGGDAGDANMGGIDGKSGRGRSFGLSTAGDVDGDGIADIIIGSVLADPRRDSITGVGVQNGGEAYLIYGGQVP